jgi:glucose dehydrogenase
MLAIRPKTGELVCYYQYTPNDVYDVDGTDENVLADLQIGGQTRKVMIQANKNGFMYVLDRTNCKPVAANAYVSSDPDRSGRDHRRQPASPASSVALDAGARRPTQPPVRLRASFSLLITSKTCDSCHRSLPLAVGMPRRLTRA